MRQWLNLARGLGLCLLLGLAGCNVRLSAADDADTRAVFDAVHRGDFQAVEARLLPELATPQADGQLKAAAALIPAAPPQSIRTVGFNAFSDQSAGVEQVSVTREYHYSNEVLVVVTSLERPAGKPYLITGFRVQPLSLAEIRSLGFGLTGKSPLHYAVLAWAVLTPILMIAALIALYRSAIKPKWLWTIFVIFGIGGLSLNWATGAIGINIGIQLLGSGFTKANAVFAPWILSVSFPLGALVVLVRTLRRPRQPPPPAPEETFV